MKLSIRISFIFIFLLSILVEQSYAQLIVQQQTATNLVQNVLLGGGVQVSNITSSGSPGAIGFFNGAGTNIGLPSGVLMTTGNLQVAIGPNNTESATIENGTGSPPSNVANALAAILGGSESPTFFNGTVISFDFIPQGDHIKFKYVFGSEEYPEYVNSEFNDVFGFFLSGPNPAGGNYSMENIATIPGTGATVAINSVNNGQTNMGPCTNCAYYVNNTGGTTIQFDAFTSVLTAEADVVPCSTYRITLAISDVGDAKYDSGVFLEAKSFQTNSIKVYPIINSPAANGMNELFEGCGTATFRFEREGNINTAQTYNYVVSGTASAADYTPNFSGVVNFAPNQSQVDLTFTAVSDGLAEGNESLTVTIVDTNPCPTSAPPSATIIIKDFNPLSVIAPPDTSIRCTNTPISLEAIINGGANNVVVWTPGNIQGNPVTVKPGQTTTYTVTVTESCTNTSVSDQVTIYTPDEPPLSLNTSKDTAICGGETIALWAQYSGGIGDKNLIWSTGSFKDTIYVSPTQTTVYTVSVTDSCGTRIEKGITVTVQSPQAQFTYAYVDNPTLQFFDQSSSDVIQWNWQFGDGDSSNLIDPLHHYTDTGNYRVILEVTNAFGCTDTISKIIKAYPPFKYYIPNTFTPEGNAINPYFNGKGEGYIQQELLIFNRWGEKIHESHELYGRGWDGYFKGAICPIGTYVYKIQLLTPTGITHKYIGHVNLIR